MSFCTILFLTVFCTIARSLMDSAVRFCIIMFKLLIPKSCFLLTDKRYFHEICSKYSCHLHHFRPHKEKRGYSPCLTCQNGPDPSFYFLNLKIGKMFKLQFLSLDFTFWAFRTPPSSTWNLLKMPKLLQIHVFCFLPTDITYCAQFIFHMGCSGHDFWAFGCYQLLLTLISYFMPLTCIIFKDNYRFRSATWN